MASRSHIMCQLCFISGNFLELCVEKDSKATSGLSRKECSYGLVISVMSLGLEEWDTHPMYLQLLYWLKAVFFFFFPRFL